MKENVKVYTISTLIFLLILSVSSGFSQPLSLVVRLFAFAVPAALALKCSEKPCKTDSYLKIDGRCALVLPAALPTLLFIFSLSYLVSFLIYSLTGLEADMPASGNLFYDLISLAALPALLEELLFRYVPIKTLAPYSKKSALLISSVFFAMAHTSFFSIPYALAAGILFMLFDLLAESVWPSVILHLLNNVISIIWIYGSESGNFVTVFLAVFISGAILSLIPILILIKKYRRILLTAFTKEDKASLPLITLALIIPTVFIAVLELI